MTNRQLWLIVMTAAQRQFWEDVKSYARSIRCMRKVDLDVAADALALEQEIEERLQAGELAAVAEVGTHETPLDRGAPAGER
jgi:hypothetical protein